MVKRTITPHHEKKPSPKNSRAHFRQGKQEDHCLLVYIAVPVGTFYWTLRPTNCGGKIQDTAILHVSVFIHYGSNNVNVIKFSVDSSLEKMSKLNRAKGILKTRHIAMLLQEVESTVTHLCMSVRKNTRAS